MKRREREAALIRDACCAVVTGCTDNSDVAATVRDALQELADLVEQGLRPADAADVVLGRRRRAETLAEILAAQERGEDPTAP